MSITAPGPTALPPKSPGPGGRCLRKSSVASLGTSLSSILSISHALQVAQTFGERVTPRRNSLTGNDLTDALLAGMRRHLKEREGQQVALPCQQAGGVELSNGSLTGLANLTRWGEASLDERPEKIYLAFTVIVKDLLATYTWHSKALRGETSTKVERVFLKLKIRQDKGTDDHPHIVDFSVGTLEGLRVGLVGLGPLNWVGRKVILGVVSENICQILMVQGKEMFRNELNQVSLLSQMYSNILKQKII